MLQNLNKKAIEELPDKWLQASAHIAEYVIKQILFDEDGNYDTP